MLLLNYSFLSHWGEIIIPAMHCGYHKSLSLNVLYNVPFVKTSAASIGIAWLNICSACKAVRKYHSANCSDIHICSWVYLCAINCPKQISLKHIYLSCCKMRLCNMLARLQIQMPYFATCTNYKSHLGSLNNGQMHNDDVLGFEIKRKKTRRELSENIFQLALKLQAAN